mmetsp:Transcript_35138/g.112933  ORF Transcript_35138/g.112933 Transcript_35138/m.112933 type:complete len:218 (+) Transcript_35138:888-1541(+)
MQAADPASYEARRHWTQKRFKRGVYDYAPYYFYSLHIDLACKIQEYHIYIAAAVDGCTRKAVSLVALVDKLPVTEYEQFFEPMARVHGLPDQIVSDKGYEWAIIAFSAFVAARLAGRVGGRKPHHFTKSLFNIPSSSASTLRSICASLSLSASLSTTWNGISCCPRRSRSRCTPLRSSHGCGRRLAHPPVAAGGAGGGRRIDHALCIACRQSGLASE